MEERKTRNHLVAEHQNLLDDNGLIKEEGWARRPVWNYERNKIKANALRIKEWDYYAITSMKGGWTLCATLSDLGYAALISVSYIDYNKGTFSEVDETKAFPLGKLGLSPRSDRDNSVEYAGKKVSIKFERKGEERRISIKAPFLVLPDGRKGLEADIALNQPGSMDSINIATSWKENRKAFYLNEKVNAMAAQGRIKRGGEIEEIEEGDAWGVLDWGRGRWRYENTWYWGSGNGSVDGHSFGFNIGYGFSDRTPASENAIFYDGKIHKIDDVEFIMDDNDYIKDWKFTSSDGRFEMDFHPRVDRFSNMNYGIIKSIQHQVFGYFSGDAVLDDGVVIHIENFPGFTEKVFNRY